MKITLRLFSHLRVIVGKRELALDLPPETNVGGALAALVVCFPDARPVVYYAGGGLGIRLLLNEADATPGQQLADGDELALLPPVGGG
jgi:molybdopterin converting factor small subunit